MRKLIFIICLIILTTTGFAQINKGESAFVVRTGFKTDPTQLLVGGSWRKAVFNNVRFAGELDYIFPKQKTMGLNLQANLHYTFCLDSYQEKMYLCPILGASMLNTRYMGEKTGGVIENKAKGSTSWGMNMGVGYEYKLSDVIFANTEMKYIFSKLDSFSWTVGLAFKY